MAVEGLYGWFEIRFATDFINCLIWFGNSFGGAGYRLGQTNDDHVLLADTSSRSTNMDPIVLRLWRQGFTINDSELRLYEDQKNKEFLECITKGFVASIPFIYK